MRGMAGEKMKTGYVSEFTAFIDDYLTRHPEAVDERKRGWNIYWNRKVDFAALENAGKDAVVDDSYGFYPADWRPALSHPRKPD